MPIYILTCVEDEAYSGTSEIAMAVAFRSQQDAIDAMVEYAISELEEREIASEEEIQDRHDLSMFLEENDMGIVMDDYCSLHLSDSLSLYYEITESELR